VLLNFGVTSTQLSLLNDQRLKDKQPAYAQRMLTHFALIAAVLRINR